MIVEIITTGTELLLGEIDNENSRWLAVFLNQHGFTVAYMTTVGDNAMRMRNAMEIALSRADIVITSGGLGATQGDITKRIGAEALGIPYVYYEDQNSRLRDIMNEKGEYILNSYRDRHGSEKVPAYLKIMLVQLMDLHLLKIIKH